MKLFSNIWFKCITCLLVIVLVSGGLLSVLNDILYVSPQERTERALKSIYGEIPENYLTVLDIDSSVENEKYSLLIDTDQDQKNDAEIKKVFIVGDKTSSEYEVIVKSTGFEGYKDGSITIWALLKYKDNKFEITKVIMETYEKQTLMSNLSSSYYDKFLVDVTKAYENGENFTSQKGNTIYNNPVSGATYSANAGNNAVNGIIKYMGEQFLGGTV